MGFNLFKPDFHEDPWANEVKSVVAKLMAQENLTVEYDPSAKGPSFNLADRILTIPFWEKITEAERDLQIGHETGHALYTPKEGWHNAVHELGPVFKSYLNIVEDARIEKLIKDRYPGLRKQFAAAYDDLNAKRDFFGLSKVPDISELPFIDRINLHFKLGSRINLNFTDDREMGYITRIDNASTFEEIEKIAREIYEHDKAEASKTDGNGLSYGKAGKLTKEKLEEMLKNAERIDSDQLSEEHQKILGEVLGGLTDMNFQEKMGDYLKSKARKETIEYANIPDLNSEEFIVDYKIIHDKLDKEWSRGKTIGVDYYTQFRNRVTNTVGYMVKDFEMKKAAADYAKINVAKTGVLNPGKFYSYKFNDDMFKRSITVPIGKSHGLVVIIDWSGSMSGIMKETMEQLFVLTLFCKKIHIPFEIFAFTSGWIRWNEKRTYNHTKLNPKNKDLYVDPYSVRLLNLVSSRMSAKDYNNGMINLFTLAKVFGEKTELELPEGFGLGGTPLDETLVLMNDFIPKFQKRSKCQIANLILLTDGEANTLNQKWVRNSKGDMELSPLAYSLNPATQKIDGPSGTYKGMIIRDLKTKTQYKGDENMTAAILKLLQQRCWVNAFGFHVLDMAPYERYSHIQLPYNLKKADFNKGFAIVLDQGFKEYYITPKTSIAIQDESFRTSASGTDAIGDAFTSHLKKMIVNKLVLSKFISHIAVDYHLVK